jgi:crotonobetaine/carnitine-CoA ligase
LRKLPLSECTVPALLERQARTYGTKPLLRVGSLTRSFEQVRDTAARMGGMLRERGVDRGDRVAVMSGNRVELLDLILGCAWIGAAAVPINTAARGASLHHVLGNSGAKVLALEPEFIERLDAISHVPSLQVAWTIGSSPQPATCYRTEPLPPAAKAVPAAAATPGQTFAILYTSGTTGSSTGVCCPHAQMYWWGVNVGEQLQMTDADTLYTCLPLFHTNALNAFFQVLVSGAVYVLGERFSASRFWRELADSQATITYLLGAMVTILQGREPGPADRTHRVRVALSPATPAALFAPSEQRFGVTLTEAYGSTETNAVIGAMPDARRPGMLGTIRPGFEAIVVGDHDEPVPDGTPGELLLRSEHPFAFATGYFKMPDKTVEAWRNLWFHTGDRVVREEDGWLRFVDRIKDVIRRRGENVSSVEVEDVIGTLPDVETVAVYGVPSEMAEDEVMTTLVLRPSHQLDPTQLIKHCETRLPYFAIPRFIDFATELPVTENGKIRKAVLRDRGVTDTTWDRDASGYR